MLFESHWLSPQEDSEESIGSDTQIARKNIVNKSVEKIDCEQGEDKCDGAVRRVKGEGKDV